jgi:hypothetical protein
LARLFFAPRFSLGTPTVRLRFSDTPAVQRTEANLSSVQSLGESCPMDAAAEVWAGYGQISLRRPTTLFKYLGLISASCSLFRFKEVIYSVSIEDLLKLNWNQIDIDSKRVYQTSQSIVNARNLVIVENVDWANQIPLFAWQNMPNNPCPTGCQKVAPGFCSDSSAYVPKPLF